MPSRNALDPIPHPPRTPWLGNLLSLGATSPVQSMAKLARQYWPIYWLDMRGKPLVVVSGHELVDELSDESRFDKSVRGALRLVRNFAGDGDAIGGALSGTMEQSGRLPLENLIRKNRDRKLRADIRHMNETVDGIIRERRESGEDLGRKQDLLSYLLSGVDKKTGERLDDLNIRYQIITFLIAGHETTSGLLSFAIYALLNNPHALARAYEEVDRVLGPDPSHTPSYAQVNQLTYVSQILKETLRLWPTAPAFALAPHKDTVIGGVYTMKKSYQIVVLVASLHRDPAVWGEKAEVFDPDHFSREAERARPANAYKPFGNGQRACIGRQFALQEATLVLGMILQRFVLIDHKRYQLKIKESLTIKPDGLTITLKRRTSADRSAIARPAAVTVAAAEPAAAASAERHGHSTPLLVLYGSNLGTAEGLARQIAEDGLAQGFAATVAPLDDYAGRLPREGAVVIATASYNGTPPDNAVRFCDWLRGGALESGALESVRYAVFGCGNQDWASTFQAIPRLIDDQLEQYGARRITPRGEGDARDDFDGQFHTWYKPLWTTVAAELGIDLEGRGAPAKEPLYAIEIVPGQRMSPFVDSLGARAMAVTVNREMHRRDGPQPSDRSTRHVELELPAGVSYRAGDHLGVIAHNAESLVKRVAARFGFERDAFVRLRRTGTRKSFLPVDETISVYRLLGDYVELQDMATRSQIQTLVEHTECKSQGTPVGRSMLFFGCRHPEQDFLYAEELAALAHDGVTDLRVAFSRLPGEKKVYVQNLLLEERDAVWQMIESGAVTYVCGDASRMAPDVRRAFAAIHAQKTGGGEAAANRWLDELTAENRYLVDVWAAS